MDIANTTLASDNTPVVLTDGPTVEVVTPVTSVTSVTPVTQPATTSPQQLFERLATLPELEYELERKKAARDIGVGLKVLDSEVKKVRADKQSKAEQQKSILPEVLPWHSSVSGEQLLDAIYKAVRDRVILTHEQAIGVASWALASHFHNVFPNFPRLGFTAAERGCGKSTALDLVGTLVQRPLVTSNITAAVMFRMIARERPTLLIDEFDSFAKGSEELRNVLNSGFAANGATHRCVGDNHEPKAFPTFAPAAFAGIGSVPATVADRSVLIRLKRKGRDEHVLDADSESLAALKPLGRMCVRFAMDNLSQLNGSQKPVIPAELHNRVRDVWRPLIAVADLCGPGWAEKIRTAAVALTASATSNENSAPTALLSNIQEVFNRRSESWITAQHLLDDLNSDPDFRWCGWNNGFGLRPNDLARMLREFDVVRTPRRLSPTDVERVYERSSFEDAFSRFLAPLSSVTDVTNVTETSGSDQDRQKGQAEGSENCAATDIDLSGIELQSSEPPAM